MDNLLFSFAILAILCIQISQPAHRIKAFKVRFIFAQELSVSHSRHTLPSQDRTPREDIEFQAHDYVTLRAWFYTPTTATSSNMPCLVLSHGSSAVKEMDLNIFAEFFVSKLPLSCLVYDNRGFGANDVKEGQPRQEIIPKVQCSDISDAIT